ncbi:D-alanine--D-alanine ligase [Usitatibacter palustris]|uniref:D-alanine--D-alanine ligase n=1 Tax=Usitatibacter palustris TaxID=2732487 RepID=A0A6M4H7A2_9PROT|nr:D-alanine--D-alanine ligase [Usitatibacter palustris]QJR13857.1 D-alanine--D-alanine ligase [Usitatibacter palustris]
MSARDFGKVAVLMGGPSAEREISLISGKAVLGALQEKRVDAHAFDPAERELFDLKREGFKSVFIALHGRFGEDGTVQGALETLRVPYTGSGVMGSAISMDKWRTKLVWLAAGIPTPKFVMLKASSDWDRVVAVLGLPLIVKPVHEGSTIGLTKVSRAADLPAAYQLAAKYDALVIAEEFIAGQELTAAILHDGPTATDRALPLVRIEAPQGNYDYQNKYFTDDTRYYCPSGIRAEVEDEIREVAVRSFRVLGCRGWGRADVMLRPDGTYSFLEMNTSPGMTGHSLVPMAAKATGLSYADLCVEILAGASLDSGARQ